MKYISSVTPEEYKAGKVDEEIIQDARDAGLSERGVAAMVGGNLVVFKLELDALQRKYPGNVWSCTAGYGLWFNAASAGQREHDYYKIQQELKCFRR